MNARSSPVQSGPPADLSPLPAADVGGPSWYREHGDRGGAARGCWWFATVPRDMGEPSGRFDLPGEEGTCYFGDSRHVAAMERVGRFTAQHVPVPGDLVSDRVISEVDSREADTVPLADVLRDIGVRVLPVPSIDEVEIINPE